MRVIFDGHLDLAWSAVSMNRDLNEPIGLIRSREQGMTDQQGRGNATVSLPTMREGGVMMCLAHGARARPARRAVVPARGYVLRHSGNRLRDGPGSSGLLPSTRTAGAPAHDRQRR